MPMTGFAGGVELWRGRGWNGADVPRGPDAAGAFAAMRSVSASSHQPTRCGAWVWGALRLPSRARSDGADAISGAAALLLERNAIPSEFEAARKYNFHQARLL